MECGRLAKSEMEKCLKCFQDLSSFAFSILVLNLRCMSIRIGRDLLISGGRVVF